MRTSIDLAYPFTGRWLVQNSPADRVPSHGTRLFATSYAIDFVPVDDTGRGARMTLGALVRPQAPGAFPGFGRAVLAPVAGVVLSAHDGEPDHAAHRGLPSIRYALTQRQRVAAGWAALAGNHVLLSCGDVVAALCHLQQGSIRVEAGQAVQVGDVLGRCGNSGNSTEPHVHVQAMDGPDPTRARPVAMTFQGSLPANGQVVRATSR